MMSIRAQKVPLNHVWGEVNGNDGKSSKKKSKVKKSRENGETKHHSVDKSPVEPITT